MEEYSVDQPAVYMALELGSTKWVLAFGTRQGRKTRQRSVQAGDLEALVEQIEQARRAYALPEDAPVFSCYEAGRDGFWLHRFLLSVGVSNCVVDSASVEVPQRRRRVKTDRLDVQHLLRQLMRYCAGDQDACRPVRAPSETEEDQRCIQREMRTLKQAQTRHVSRIRSLLKTRGISVARVDSRLAACLSELVGVSGERLGRCEENRIRRELERLETVERQIDQIKRERLQRVREEQSPQMDQIRALLRLKGIGMESAWLFVTEMFGWREFSNRRQVAAFSGLSPTPYGSDQTRREQGISKAGNHRVRTMAVEIAWKWLEHQPHSELTQWFQRRYGCASTRVRRSGIVALARKLLVSLWKYLQWGQVPAGAELKPPIW